jgi:hypothetical protein
MTPSLLSLLYNLIVLRVSMNILLFNKYEYHIMARLTIDTGTAGNPATGDTLRTAMTKVNANFNELYDSDLLALVGGLIKTQTTNGDIKLQPNGTGVVEVDRILFSGDDITSLVTNGSINITANGTGSVGIESISFKDNVISASDSTLITIQDGFTIGLGGVAITGILDEDNLSSNSASALATQQSIKSYVDSQITATNTLTVADDTSTTIDVDLDSTLSVAGATGISTSVSGQTLTITGPNLSSYLQNTGTQTIDNLTFNDNTIGSSSNADINISPGGTGNVAVTRPLVMASFTTTQRGALTAANGMMIYNTTTNQFEGYENGAWISLKADTADAG